MAWRNSSGLQNVKLNNWTQKNFISDKFEPATLISVPIFCQSTHITRSGKYHPSSQHLHLECFLSKYLGQHQDFYTCESQKRWEPDMRNLSHAKLLFLSIFEPWFKHCFCISHVLNHMTTIKLVFVFCFFCPN